MTSPQLRPRPRSAVVALTAVAVLALLATPALAHVTVRTDDATAGAFAKYTVRVPNERDEAATVKVEVRIPEGLDASLYQPVPGWDIALAEGVLTAEGGSIAPGQFQEFSFTARNPEAPTELAFPALQTYSDGQVVEWIGDERSETPASAVAIVPAAQPTADAAVTDGSAADDDGGRPVAYAGLALGAAGLLAAGGALWRTRRS